jgi:hypothetical protein
MSNRASLFTFFIFGSQSPADERRAHKHPNISTHTAGAPKPGGFFSPVFSIEESTMNAKTTAPEGWYPNAADRPGQTDDERIKDITVLPRQNI